MSAASAARSILTTLHEVMAARTHAQAKLNQVVEVIGDALDSEVCSIYLLRDGMLELFATRGLNQAAVHVTRLGVGEGLTAVFCLAFALIAAWVVRETWLLDERSVVLRLAVWPFQLALPAAFLIAALRHGAYGIWPALRPAERGEGDQHGEPPRGALP